MRETPDCDRYERDVLNAMHDAIGLYHEDARTVMEGEEEFAGRSHYGEIQLLFEQGEDGVEAHVLVNYLARTVAPNFFTVEDGVLEDNPTNEDVREVVGKAVEPLGMDEFRLVEDTDLTGPGSGWCGFVVRADR